MMPHQFILTLVVIVMLAVTANSSMAQLLKSEDRGVTAGRDIKIKNGIIQTGDGKIIIYKIDGIDPADHERIAKQLGVTESALKSFFKILQQNQVPLEDLDRKLREIASQYKELQEQLNFLEGEDPAVDALRQQASKELEAGDFQNAERLLEEARKRDFEAIEELEQRLKKRRLSGAATTSSLGSLKMIQLAYDEAAAYYREAARTLASLDEPLIRARYLNSEGTAWRHVGQYAKALTSLETALFLTEKAFNPEHPDVATILNNLAMICHAQGRYTSAEPIYQRALAIREKALDPDHPNMARSLNNLAELYREQGRSAEAEPRYQHALIILEKALGLNHPDVATSLNNLALLYREQGRSAEAEPRYQRALAIWEKVFGPEHPNVATILNNLAELYREQGRSAEAGPRYQRALAIWEKVFGPEHPAVSATLNNLAMFYDDQGRRADAELFYQRALAIREKVLGPEHPYVSQSLNNLARFYREQSRYAEAEPLYQRALAIREKAFDLGHPYVAEILNNLARLYHVQGRYTDAEPRYQRALAIVEKVLRIGHPNTLAVLSNYYELLTATNRKPEAQTLLARFQAAQPKRSWLGIGLEAQDDPPGILVTQVINSSPAAKAGLQPDDLIVYFHGQQVQDQQAFMQLVSSLPPETEVAVELLRGGQPQTLSLTLGLRPLVLPDQQPAPTPAR